MVNGGEDEDLEKMVSRLIDQKFEELGEIESRKYADLK